MTNPFLRSDIREINEKDLIQINNKIPEELEKILKKMKNY